MDRVGNRRQTAVPRIATVRAVDRLLQCASHPRQRRLVEIVKAGPARSACLSALRKIGGVAGADISLPCIRAGEKTLCTERSRRPSLD
jgi:hypothetical protein